MSLGAVPEGQDRKQGPDRPEMPHIIVRYAPPCGPLIIEAPTPAALAGS